VNVPDPSLGLLIIAARHSIRQAIGAHARRYRLTTPQFWGLVGLRRSPGLTPGEIGQWMQLDPPAASRLVADLSSRKLVEVRPDREDRRRLHLFLSPQGDALSAELDVIAREYQQVSVDGLSPEEQSALRSGLRRVVENLARFDEREIARAAPRRSDAPGEPS
jgi:DNA-binding MarR family transcriptional regulator